MKRAGLEAIATPHPLEDDVNREGIDSIFLFQRLHNPEIRKQVIDTLCEIETVERERDRQNLPGPFVREEKTREQIEREFDKRLVGIERYTPISFDPNIEPHAVSGGREMISLEWVFPVTGKKLTPNMLGIVEAHEKGHVMLPYFGSFIDREFQKVFDQSHVKFTETDYETISTYIAQHGEKVPLRQIKGLVLGYLFSANEIAQRMSQLKSYFSMKDDALFTKKHLDYAREHYVKDTDMDNWMTHFFQAITSEKEEAFLRLINSMGI